MKEVSKGRFAGAVIALALAIVFLASLMSGTPAPTVQAAVITPVAVTGRGADEARIAQYFVTKVLTADSRICFDLKDYETMDLQYAVDATAANATTITFQQTNIDPTSGPFNSAQVIATVSTPTDTDTFSQVGVFGRWNCVFADVTNSSPITLTIIGVAK